MKTLKVIGWTSCLYRLKWITLIYIFSLAVEPGSQQVKVLYWWDGAQPFSRPRGKCLTKLLPNPVRSKTKTYFSAKKILQCCCLFLFLLPKYHLLFIKNCRCHCSYTSLVSRSTAHSCSLFFLFFCGFMGGGLPQLKPGYEMSVMAN